MEQSNNNSRSYLLILGAILTIALSAFTAYLISNNVTNNSNTKSDEDISAHEVMKSKLMVHISSGVDEPHSVMMGLQKALKANEAGTDVFVFMDVKATDLALKTTDIKFADFPPSQELIATLIDKGVEVYVCPHCLMVNGDKMTDVQQGIKELTMEAMINFSKDASLITLDY